MQEINGIGNRNVPNNKTLVKPERIQEDLQKKIGDLDSSNEISIFELENKLKEYLEKQKSDKNLENITDEQLKEITERLNERIKELPKDKDGQLKKPPVGLMPNNPKLPDSPSDEEIKPVPLPYKLTPEEVEKLKKY